MEKKNLLQEEVETYEEHKEELLKESEGKYVLIKGNKIVDMFESEKDAIRVGYENFGNTPFLVKKVEAIEEIATFTGFYIKAEA